MRPRIIKPEESLKKLRALDPEELLIVCKMCGKGISRCQEFGDEWNLVCLNPKCKNTWFISVEHHTDLPDNELEDAEFRRITIREHIQELEEKREYLFDR